MPSPYNPCGSKGYSHHPLAVEFIKRMAGEGLDVRTAQAVLADIDDLLSYTRVTVEDFETVADRYKHEVDAEMRRILKTNDVEPEGGSPWNHTPPR